MSALGDVLALLTEEQVPHALIGASALSRYGVMRSTQDIDLLVLDTRTLWLRFWKQLRDQGHTVDVRVGDIWDPLAGVIRVNGDDVQPVDVVVGASPRWQEGLLQRAYAQQATLDGVRLPVVDAADLVLLKMYAGGPRDRRDVEELLLNNPLGLREVVDQRIQSLPAEAQSCWRAVVAGLER